MPLLPWKPPIERFAVSSMNREIAITFILENVDQNGIYENKLIDLIIKGLKDMIWDLEKEFPVTQMMNRDGKLIDGSYEDLIDETLVQTFYRQLVCMRAFDQKVINLQRQGRIGTYPG